MGEGALRFSLSLSPKVCRFSLCNPHHTPTCHSYICILLHNTSHHWVGMWSCISHLKPGILCIPQPMVAYGMRSCLTPQTFNLSRPFHTTRCLLCMVHPLKVSNGELGAQILCQHITTLILKNFILLINISTKKMNI